MNGKSNILLAACTLFLAFPDASSAQQAQSYSYAYIRYLVGNAEVQRATEAEPAEAGLNLPIESGDRVWTHADARVELEYGNGSILRMDSQTRIDFVGFGEQGGETFIRLWSGSIILRLDEGNAKSFRLDTPAGTIYPASAGTFRIDVNSGGESTVLSVYEGVAELASEEGSVLARSGQRSIIEPGRRPEPSFAFNTAHYDDFLAWNDDRDSQYAQTEHIEGVPPEVGGYVGALSHHGTWRVDVQLGPVWYPSVSVGWYPYHDGRWVYSSYGWTWASHEPWGWAPYHYGRWGYNHSGWYWIPGASWGPAWVSWAIGPSWVGWCPLGYRNRPVHHYDRIWGRGGKAVPRGGVVPRTRGHSWNFVRTADFGRRSSAKARLRTADIQSTSRQAQLLESGAVLDRGLRPRGVGAAAMTRRARIATGASTRDASVRRPRSGVSELEGVARSGGQNPQRSVTGRPSGQIDSSTRTSGTLQEGRARRRTAPGDMPSRTSSTSSSTLRQGTSRASTPGASAGASPRQTQRATPGASAGASPRQTQRATPARQQGLVLDKHRGRRPARQQGLVLDKQRGRLPAATHRTAKEPSKGVPPAPETRASLECGPRTGECSASPRHANRHNLRPGDGLRPSDEPTLSRLLATKTPRDPHNPEVSHRLEVERVRSLRLNRSSKATPRNRIVRAEVSEVEAFSAGLPRAVLRRRLPKRPRGLGLRPNLRVLRDPHHPRRAPRLNQAVRNRAAARVLQEEKQSPERRTKARKH